MKKVSLFKDFWEDFKKVLNRPDMIILPGQLAFFFVLAIVPTITLITYEAAFLNLSTDVIYDFLSRSFTSDIASLLLTTKETAHGGIGFFLVVAVGYYIASNGPASIIVTSNAIYGVKQESFFRRRMKAIIMTFVLVLLFIFMLVVPVFGSRIIEMFEYVDISRDVTLGMQKAINFFQGPITWLVMFIFIKILYTMAPNKNVKSKDTSYGAVFTTISWIVTTYIYSFYVNNLAHYSTFYGGLANIVILMIWIYFLAYFFTVGMALNSLRDETKMVKNDTIK